MAGFKRAILALIFLLFGGPVFCVEDLTRGLTLSPSVDGSQYEITPDTNLPASKNDSVSPDSGSPLDLPKLQILESDRAEADDAFRKSALVFGNSEYEHVPSLANTVRDAQLMAATFQSMGFAVWLGLDLTYVEMLETTRDFVARSTGSQVIVFYYAGHGIEIGGRNLIFGTDAEVSDLSSLEANTIDIGSIINLIESNGATTIVFVDACRDNPLAGDFQGQVNTAEGGLAKMEARTGTMVNYATAPGLIAFDGPDENSPFTMALAKHLPTPGLPIELAMVRVRADVFDMTDGRQVPWSNSSLLTEIALVPGAVVPPTYRAVAEVKPKRQTLDPDLASFLQAAVDLRVNGRAIEVRGASPDGRVDGVLASLEDGLNYIESGAVQMKVWVEDQTAYIFSRGYEYSHAILIAIDDYPRSTGFQELAFMESHAARLADRLVDMGFPRENIVQIFGHEATRERILEELDKYWGTRDGGRQDRLLIYFGGHGSHLDRETGVSSAPTVPDGILIPYDYDPDRPLKSAILLEDLRNHNFKRSTAHHTMILLDACSSGLILQKYEGEPAPRPAAELSVNQRWRRIRTALENPHTSMIVAGTGEERALWENGGVFTKVLIEGLEGSADINVDGIISYDELASYLSEQVRVRTADIGVSQTPANFDTGSGRFIFEWSRF